MPEDHDPFEENLARLLRHAPGPPTMDPGRKQLVLDTLQDQFQRATAARGRTIMKRWIRGLTFAAAAAAALVVAFILTRGPGSREHTVHRVGSSVMVRLSDGTRIYERDRPKYAVLGDRRLRLDSGQILLFVARSDKPFVVETPQARAEARGTIFTVSASRSETFVAVGQGRVDLINDGGQAEVRPGQQAFAGATGAPRRSPAPRFSHTVNWAREHLKDKKLFEGDEKHASGELVAVDPWGQQVRLELRRYHIDVVIEDGIARTTVDQTFFNHLTSQIEGTFYFPLPPDASLSRLAMYVNGQLNEGGMVERQYGRYVYESIVYRRRDPALLEMMEGNVFKMRVFPIFGRREKRIVLSYTQTLPELYRTLRYWFPMEHTNDKAGELSIRVRVKGGEGKYEALSSTHEITTRADEGDLLVTYDAKNVAPDQDFLLNLTDEQPDGKDLDVTRCKQDGSHFVFARWRPPLRGAVEPRRRQWFLINDVSASRSSVDAKAQAYVIERLLAEADDGDTFALVNLDTRATPWKTELTAVRDPHAVSVAGFTAVGERMGATNIQAALTAVTEMIQRSGADNAHVVYLGDGVATDGETKTSELVRALPAGAVFVGLGVGKKVDGRFLQAAADATGGVFATLNPNEDLRWRVFDLMASLNTRRLVQVRVTFLDGRGKPMKVDAFPSAGAVSDGEALTVVARAGDVPPARMMIFGESGGKTSMKEYALDQARDGAAYIPRLWATACINHLLREDADAHKAEIVALSKQYYVVTPFTSLIVLENKADYEKWKVEMGRKDHWQLYPAPKKIKVVTEPVEGNAWRGPSPPVKGTAGHPKTIEEIVGSVQFRVHVPLYGHYPHQRRRMERFRLHALLSGRLAVAAHGALAPLPILLTDDAEDGGAVNLLMDMDGDGGLLGLGPAMRPALPNGKPSGWWGLARIDGYEAEGDVSGFYSANGRVTEKIPMYFKTLALRPPLNIEGLDEGTETRLRVLNGYEGHALRDLQTSRFVMGWDLAPDMPMEVPALARPVRGLIAGEPLLMSGLRRHVPRYSRREGELRGDLLLDAKNGREFHRAQLGRWKEDRNRVLAYNRRYGGWSYEGWNQWDDFKDKLDVTEWETSVRPLIRLTGGTIDEWSGEVDKIIRVASPVGTPPPPLQEPAAISHEALPPMYLRAYARTIGAVPGTLAALTADRLLPLSEKLKALKPSDRRDKAVAFLGDLMKKLPKLSVASESTGIFWSHQGWSVLPQRWDFQQPQCQTWAGSRAMTDLTRYAPALESTWSDVADVVLEAFGKPRRGQVDAEAAKRIAAARRNTPTLRVKYVNKKGDVLWELWAGSGDRFAWTGRSSMYLREDFFCDGNSLYHVYPELGLAARRTKAKRRIASIRALTPHLLPPADELARGLHVTLAEADDPATTIRLTPIGPEPKKQASAPAPPRLAVLVTFDNLGFISRKVWEVDGEARLTCTYAVGGSLVEGKWTAGDKTLREFSYRCEVVKPSEDPLAPKLKDIVVLDMPLRRPAHYSALLKEAGKDPNRADERMRLRRHLALSQIQELNWQSPWGNVQQAWQTMLAGLQERAAAGRKGVLPGDVAIIASAGHPLSLLRQGRGLQLPTEHPLSVYWLHQRNVAEMKKLAENHPGSFVGHLAAHDLAHRGGGERVAAVRRLIRDYGNSRLLYAAASYCGANEGIWLELAKKPRWRLPALLTAAQHKPSAKIAEAFDAYHKEMTGKGRDVPVSSRMVAALKMRDDLWQGVVKRRLAAAMKSKDVGALLRFAEFAWPHGEKELASMAIDRAGEQVGEKLPLTWKLTLAHSLWAMGRTKEAWERHAEVLAALESKGIEPSPALLALAARLAQHAGQSARAVELELRAIRAEQPYMPKRINVRFFRQRYQWLWSQLASRVQQCAAAVKADAADASKRRALADVLAQAKDVWDTWKRVDGAHSARLYQQLASLHRHAGDAEAAWRVVSSVIDQKPRDGSSYYSVGSWYAGHGERDVAQQWYAKAYVVEPTNGDWIWRRAELLRGMGRKDEAKVLYKEMAEKKWQPRFQHYNRNAKERLKKL